MVKKMQLEPMCRYWFEHRSPNRIILQASGAMECGLKEGASSPF